MTDEVKTTEQKVEFGLENVHYALLTDTGTALEYEKPKPWIGAKEISFDPEGEANPFYADNTVFFNPVANNGYSGKLTMARVTDQFRVDVLGDTIDSNGVLVEHGDGQPKPFALLFEFSGDKKATRHVLYDVTITRPSEGSATKEDKIDPNTQEVSFTAGLDPYTKVPKTKTTQDTDPAAYSAWYDAVYKPDMVITAPKV